MYDYPDEHGLFLLCAHMIKRAKLDAKRTDRYSVSARMFFNSKLYEAMVDYIMHHNVSDSWKEKLQSPM